MPANERILHTHREGEERSDDVPLQPGLARLQDGRQRQRDDEERPFDGEPDPLLRERPAQRAAARESPKQKGSDDEEVFCDRGSAARCRSRSTGTEGCRS
jgi:hypothetical protein